jgi:hypothetical protein
MRKILLGTTAVVGAALLAPGAFAQAPVTTVPGGGAGLRGDATTGASAVTVPAPAIAAPGGLSIRLGGYFDFRSAYIQDDWDRARSRIGSAANGGGAQAQARSRYDFQNDSELFVFVNGTASNGLTYGATFEFQMDGQGGTANTVVDLDEAYMFIGTPTLGRLTLGQEDSAASMMAVRAPGVGELADGNWSDFIINAGLFSSPYMLAGINDGNDATKIIYTSPQFAGFDFGVSYAPQSASEGRRIEQTGTLGGAATSFQRDRTTAENEFSLALRYRGTFGPVGVNAGVGAMFADAASLQTSGNAVAVNSRQQDINAYTVGLSVSAYGFALGGEFTWGQWNGGSPGRTAMNPGLEDSKLYVIGATYTFGPVLIGANFGQAFQDNGVRSVAGGGFANVADRTHTYWGVGAVYLVYNNINDENIPTAAPTNARYGGAGTSLASFNGGNTRTINMGLAGIRLAF